MDANEGRSSIWDRKQRRVFNRIVSWCFETKGRACQLSRVDLTTSVGGPVHLLRRHLQELRRRVERDLGYKGIETFVVETSEGNGVLHMVWAWAGNREFIIEQRWLSEMWATIHGAPIVFIRRMNLAKESIRCVGRYFALQYLSDQRGALVRMSWSWRRARFAIGKAWKFMCRARGEINRHRQACDWRYPQPDLPFSDLLVAWENLLARGWCVLGSTIVVAKDREVFELFGPQNG